jgi:hypothetical protein
MKTDDLITLLARQPDALPRTNPTRDLLLALAVGLTAAFGLMAVTLSPRPDLAAAVAAPLFWQKAGALAALAALAAWAAHRAGRPGRALAPLERARWAVPAWLLAATAMTLAVTPAGERGALFLSPTILVCLSMIPALAVAPALALTWAMRRAAPTDPPRAARAIGWAAGAMGGLAYAFHCQADQPGYVLLWYGLAIAFTVVATQAIASRWLRW